MTDNDRAIAALLRRSWQGPEPSAEAIDRLLHAADMMVTKPRQQPHRAWPLASGVALAAGLVALAVMIVPIKWDVLQGRQEGVDVKRVQTTTPTDDDIVAMFTPGESTNEVEETIL